MTDIGILNLYWHRAPEAISESENAYGAFCYRIAFNILSDGQDAEESVNDTWLAAWNAIPPTWPKSLQAYLGKITRRISVSRLRSRLAAKRGGGEAVVAMDELEECIPYRSTPVQELEGKELSAALNRFLASLREDERNLFVARYWYSLSMSQLCQSFALKESAVKTRLYRTREKLRTFLEKEGYR